MAISKLLSEYVSTLIFALGIFVGGSFIAKANNSKLVVAGVVGLALAIGVFVSLSLSGPALLNPAFTILGFYKKDFDLTETAGLVIVQVLAVMSAWLLYSYIAPLLTNVAPQTNAGKL